MKYTCINIQGNLISEEILQKIEQGNADGQLPKDFGLDSGTNLRSEIEYAWSRIKLDWKHFSERIQNLPANDPYGTTLSRKWMNNFLSSLNFELIPQKAALIGDNNQTYSISHVADGLDGLPIHIVGFYELAHPEKNTLDIKSSGGTSRMSPHGTVQEYLNVTEHLYGIATNGLTLRLIRDSGRLVKLTYVEFDLKRMLEEDKYSEFTLLYRLLHSTRFPRSKQEADQCLLEKYYQDSIETGNRIRDGLSRAVKESLLALGQGFLQHEHNTALRQKLQAKQLSSKDFYRQLLRLIYRFLFLMVTEERDLVYDPDDPNTETLRKKRVYLQFYSIARLRKLSQNRYVYEAQYNDLWQGLVQTFQLFEEGGKGRRLGIEPLAGDLFNESAIRNLESSLISNQLLLECVRNLNEFTDDSNNLVPINYRSLDVEELGSVYEGLLELHPVIENIEATNPAQINFTFHEGTDRKTTGSYYTRPDLVHELIKSALIPVIEERLKEHAGNKDAQAKALLKLKVCDAAAGSGHMLLAAARTIAWYLARVLTGEENPAPGIYRQCLRDVIQHCIYAVDMNPDAVELCKLALWLESHNSGKPLSFLDHKIRNGNSLVGVTDLSVLQKGIPDEAFNAVTGDDKAVCKELKKLNGDYNKRGMGSLFEQDFIKKESKEFSESYHQLDDINQDNVEAVSKVRRKFEILRNDRAWYKDWRACNLWTAAFFFNYTAENKEAAPTSERLAKFLSNPSAAYGPMIGKADSISIENKFFHWPLEFPDVFEQGGFDVMLGNPPWEMVQFDPREFFLTKNADVIKAENFSKREKIINELKIKDPALYSEYDDEKHKYEAFQKSLHASGNYKYSNFGRLNTATLFTELVSKNINDKGAAGIIVPTGTVTDSFSQYLFEHLLNSNMLLSIYDFENKLGIFPSVHRAFKFILLTLKAKNKDKLEPIRMGFYLNRIEQIELKDRNILISKEDIERINPNTKNCAVLRTSIDAEIIKQLYIKHPILKNLSGGTNEWKLNIKLMFMMNTDSHKFKALDSVGPTKGLLQLYEGKMCFLYNHRAAGAYFNLANVKRAVQQEESTLGDLIRSDYRVKPGYWIEESELTTDFVDKKYFFVYRKVTSPTNERTVVSCIIPKSGIGDSLFVMLFEKSIGGIKTACFSGNFSCLILDYVAKQKVGGVNLNIFHVEQLPVLAPSHYSKSDFLFIIPRVMELTYSAWDIKAFADDIWQEADPQLKMVMQRQWQDNQAATGGHDWNPPDWAEQPANPSQPGYTGCPLPPFKWDEERRAVLKAELDAIYAKLYGLTTDELRYILDPQDVYGPDFPGETFRVLKEKEMRLYGEYRTRRLVLEAWEKLNKQE